MELRHLRYFVAVAETENVSRAAMRLHVSQPSLSRQIRDLEEEIGFPLLERRAKSVRVTEGGRAFLGEARSVLERLDEGIRAARAVAAGGGELNVGYAPTPTVDFLPAALRAFQALSPRTKVKLHDLTTAGMLDGLREGALQVAFLVRPTRSMMRGIEFEELVHDPMRIALSPGHRFAGAGTVRVAELAEEPMVVLSRAEYTEYHELLDAVFAGTGFKPVIAGEHESWASLMAAAEAGIGVAYIQESMKRSVGPRLKFVPLEPSPDPLVVGAAWAKGRHPPTAENFLNCAREAVRACGHASARSATVSSGRVTIARPPRASRGHSGSARSR